MGEWSERTRLLVGDEGIERLANATVVLFGLGGVGSYAAEAIARAGVGHIVLVDSDCVEPTNLNRQLVALNTTIGRAKVEVARERILDINPGIHVETHRVFVTPDNAHEFLRTDKAYYIDAIDHLPAKLALLKLLHAQQACFVSCMGAASKLEVLGIRVADISVTANCPLARRIRQQLRKEGIAQGIRCVYSEAQEVPGAAKNRDCPKGGTHQRAETGLSQEFFAPRTETPESFNNAPSAATRKEGPRVRGTISYLPGLVGLTAAGVIINDILQRG